MLNKQTILSFDVGIKNLAYSIIHHSKNDYKSPVSVEDFGIIDISVNGHIDTKDMESLSCSILKSLHAKFHGRSFDCVAIENQPCLKNPVMKTVQMIIHTYFMHKKVLEDPPTIKTIVLCAAASKLKPSRIVSKDDIAILESQPDIAKTTNKYSRRKKLSAAIMKHLLETKKMVIENDELLVQYNNTKKVDDISDSMLQAIFIAAH